MKSQLGFLFLLLALGLAACSDPEKTTRPIRRDIVQAVYASGKIYPMGYYKAAPTLPGYIKQIYVAVGDTIRLGQPLFTIKNEVSGFNVQSARQNLELAEANAAENSALLATLKKDVASAQSKYQLDSTNYERYKKLRTENASSQIQLDQAETAWKTARETLLKAQANLRATRLRLQTELKNARTVLQAQLSQAGDFTIVSSLEGKVYDVMGKIGEYATPQTPVMELGQVNDYEIELSVDEADINFLKPGQEVVYTAEAFEGQFFKGLVKQVYPKINAVNKSIKVTATISLPAGSTVYAGSTFEANIVYARRQKALLLPKSFVFNDSVYVREGVGLVKKAIKPGLRDVEYVEVLSGVEESQEVHQP